MNRVLAPNGHDGLRAEKDLNLLLHHEYNRVQARKMIMVGAAGSGFCLMNCLRFGTLS